MKLELAPEDFFLEEFSHSRQLACGCTYPLWGNEWGFELLVEHTSDTTHLAQEKLPYYLSQFEKHLVWMGQNKELFLQALVHVGVAEPAENPGPGNSFTQNKTPERRLAAQTDRDAAISVQSLRDSIISGEVNVSIDTQDDSFLYDIFLTTQPDLFAGRSIEVFLEPDSSGNYQISVNGFAG